MNLQVYIASDHAGFTMKEYITKWLTLSYMNMLPKHIKGLYVIDMGPSREGKCDYPDYAHMVSKLVSLNKNSIGIVICGTGIGMSIVCNRYPDIRCALCDSVTLAKLSREHNNSNVVALGSRVISQHTATKIIETFIGTKFLEGRHTDRIAKINK